VPSLCAPRGVRRLNISSMPPSPEHHLEAHYISPKLMVQIDLLQNALLAQSLNTLALSKPGLWGCSVLLEHWILFDSTSFRFEKIVKLNAAARIRSKTKKKHPSSHNLPSIAFQPLIHQKGKLISFAICNTIEPCLVER
jgi:hypothetical protein